MPLARMLSRSETVQSHAAKNEGLKAFLERKGDEHCFSLLYLVAGIFCLVASFGYGGEFCTGPISTLEMASSMHSSAILSSVRGLWSQTPTQQELRQQSLADSEPETGGSNPIASAWNRFQADIKFPAVKARRGPPSSESTGSDVLQAALADLVTGNETKAQEDLTHAPKHAFLGPTGLVVLWLKVEGITALGLPIVSILMLSVGLHEVKCVSCMLYLVAVFQACWLILGCVWAFGGFVPRDCASGAMGSSFAFNTMWWVCFVWLASMAIISVVIFVMICVLAGATFITNGRPSGRDGGPGYTQVPSGRGGANGSDSKNNYV
jgi:hypothetical protein